MTTRRLRGLDAISGAAVQAAPAIHVLVLADIPRTGLTPKEFAASAGLSYDWVLDEIHAGRIKVLTSGPGNRRYVIPVGELLALMNRARNLDSTG